MGIKIIGSGLGRTGTHSLKLALEQLGFGKCYHMAELLQHPEGLSCFEDAEAGRAADWDKLFSGYQSAVDYPVARYYKMLMEKYPEAKVVHTVRDPESWYQSASQTIMWASKPTPGRIFKMMLKLPFAPELRKQMPVLKFNGKLIDWEFGPDCKNKEAVIQRFNRHNEDVLRHVPRERLFVFEVKQGWGPLCNFLGVAVPDIPFPVSNNREEFISRIKNIGDKINI